MEPPSLVDGLHNAIFLGAQPTALFPASLLQHLEPDVLLCQLMLAVVRQVCGGGRRSCVSLVFFPGCHALDKGVWYLLLMRVISKIEEYQKDGKWPWTGYVFRLSQLLSYQAFQSQIISQQWQNQSTRPLIFLQGCDIKALLTHAHFYYVDLLLYL